MNVSVFCRTTFEAMHHWPAAPSEVGFLASLHRHVFHVRVDVKVSHDDRDVEFILLKRKVNRFIAATIAGGATLTWSCERWASEIMQHVGACRVEVDEDGENGATVEA